MLTSLLSSLEAHDLGDGLQFFSGKLPPELTWDDASFEQAWALHPTERPVITMIGKPVAIPRWQKAYGRDYHFSNQTSVADPIPELFNPLLTLCQENIETRLNGLLLNWYEGPGHYIGAHHDAHKELFDGTPIVTISFGEARNFRLIKGREKRDFLAPNGTVFVLPYDTNLAWKHLVPKSTKYHGRRISVMMRAFRDLEREQSFMDLMALL